MTRRLLLALAASVTAVLGLGVQPAEAGRDAASSMQIVAVDTADHPTVSMVVTVPSGLANHDLSAAFGVREAREPRDAEVERVSTDGLEVVLVIDTSGSMEGAPMAAARDAAKAFVADLPQSTPLAVLGFGAAPAVAAPFSNDRGAAVSAIDQLVPAGETALYDAVRAAVALPGVAARRAIVLLSDGGDTVSAAPIDGAVEALKTSNASISIVELVSPESDHDALVVLADARDGRVVAASDPSGLRDAYAAVAADLVGRYRITYTSTKAGPTDVTVVLDTPDGEVTADKRLTLPGRIAPTPTTPTFVSAEDAGFLASNTALMMGAGLLGVAMLWFLATVLRPKSHASRLATTDKRSDAKPTMSTFAQRASAAAERTLDRRNKRRTLDQLLEQGGIALRAGELVVIGGAATIGGLLLGSVLLGPLGGIVLAAVVVLGIRTLLIVKRGKRQRQFADLLDDTLQMLAGSLRAGYGLMQAIDAAAREAESPMADELRRVSAEVRLGRDFVESLESMSARMSSEDFSWVVQAIRIHREVGGDLGEVLDRVGETIRARGRLQRHVRALSAEGRISAYVLTALPFTIAAAMAVLNPGYLRVLYTTSVGAALLVVAAVLMTTGTLWLRKIVRPTY